MYSKKYTKQSSRQPDREQTHKTDTSTSNPRKFLEVPDIAPGAMMGNVERSMANQETPAIPPPEFVQPKLTIGQPSDRYEREADRVAKEVVHSIRAPEPTASGEPSLQCKTEAFQEIWQPTLQAKGDKGGQELIAHELTHVVQQNGVGRSTIQRDGDKPKTSQRTGQVLPYQSQAATAGMSAFDAAEHTSLQVAQVNTLLVAAESAKDTFMAIVNDLVAETNAHFGDSVCHHTGFEKAVKSWKSATRKAKATGINWGQGVAHALMDILRATIACDDYDAMIVAERVVKQKIQFGLAQYKDFIPKLTPDLLMNNSFDWQMSKEGNKGYGDIKGFIPVEFAREDGPEGYQQGIILAELQILHKQLDAVKQHGGGHTFYELQRAFGKSVDGGKPFERSQEAIDAATELRTDERLYSYLAEFPLSIGLLTKVLATTDSQPEMMATEEEYKALGQASDRFYTEQFWDKPDVTI
ncbi:MAG: DUF4157 domain-containing protein [Cyanobacteria bacterium P01_E01_bin.42]